MDMAMALEWVYRNIRFFNGDPQKITVFGPGAGGAMAGILAVLPKTKDWVHQVLAEVSLTDFSVKRSRCFLAVLFSNSGIFFGIMTFSNSVR